MRSNNLLACVFITLVAYFPHNSDTTCGIIEFDNSTTNVVVNATIDLECVATGNSCSEYYMTMEFRSASSNVNHTLDGEIDIRICNQTGCWMNIRQVARPKYDQTTFFCRIFPLNSVELDSVTLWDSSIDAAVVRINWTTPTSLTGIPLSYSVKLLQNRTVIFSDVTKSTKITISTATLVNTTNPCDPIRLYIMSSIGNLTSSTSIFSLKDYFPARPKITKITYKLKRNLYGNSSKINIYLEIEAGIQHCPGRSPTTVVISVQDEEYRFPVTATLNGTVKQNISLTAHQVYSISARLENEVGLSEQTDIQNISLLLISGGSLRLKGSTLCASCHFSDLSVGTDECHIDISVPVIEYHDQAIVKQNGSMLVEHCFTDLPFGNHTIKLEFSDVDRKGEPYKLTKDVEVQDETVKDNFGLIIGLLIGSIIVVVVVVVVVALLITLTIVVAKFAPSKYFNRLGRFFSTRKPSTGNVHKEPIPETVTSFDQETMTLSTRISNPDRGDDDLQSNEYYSLGALASDPELSCQVSGALDTHQDKELDTDEDQKITTTATKVSNQGTGPEEHVVVDHLALHRTSITISLSLDPSSNSEEQPNTQKATHQHAQDELETAVPHSPEESTGEPTMTANDTLITKL